MRRRATAAARLPSCGSLAATRPLALRPTRVNARRVGIPATSSRLAHTLVVPEDGHVSSPKQSSEQDKPQRPVHAVISTFDLLSFGIGPSSSHTVGPMRAAKIFVEDLRDAGILDQVKTLRVALYGSLAATGKGHMSVEALMMGFESEDCETVDTDTVIPRYDAIRRDKTLVLGANRQIDFDLSKDLTWYYDKSLPRHPNGMTFSVFGADGNLLASNTYYSIGGGFVVNDATEFQGENLYYKQIRKADADPMRREGRSQSTAAPAGDNQSLPGTGAPAPSDQTDVQLSEGGSKPPSKPSDPPMLFSSGQSLLQLCKKNNMTIAQLVWENERHYYSDQEIRSKLLKLFNVMDECIHQGVTSSEEFLPGGLGVRRRAKMLYNNLARGLYPSPPGSALKALERERNSLASIASLGRYDHPVQPIKPRRFSVPTMEALSTYAIAVNEVNASGGRVVTSPTNGAAGVIPAVLKYFIEFVSTPDEMERDISTFLLTASAIGMLFKQGATISAAEGGCMAEVGVAASMAAGAFAACLGASPSVIENAAEIAIEHNLGLTCDPIDGLVQVPCVERNAMGAVKAVTAASLAIAGEDAGTGAVSLDQAISAMRETAEMMREELKETSRAGLARTSVRIPEC